MRKTPTPRPGSVYIAVLGVAMIIALVAMASIHLARNETLVLAGSEQMVRAEMLAASAEEFAVCRIKNDPSWRTTFTSGTEVPSGSSWMTLGTGSIKYVITDADGSLTDDDRDVVTVKVIGRMYDSIQAFSVKMEPTGTPLDCLASAFHAGGDLDCKTQTLTCERVVSCNGDLKGGSAQINGDAWATGNIGPSVTGTKPRTSPRRSACRMCLVFGITTSPMAQPSTSIPFLRAPWSALC